MKWSNNYRKPENHGKKRKSVIPIARLALLTPCSRNSCIDHAALLLKERK